MKETSNRKLRDLRIRPSTRMINKQGEVKTFNPSLDKRMWETVIEPIVKPAYTIQYLMYLSKLAKRANRVNMPALMGNFFLPLTHEPKLALVYGKGETAWLI